jgi:DNA-binding NarL/FixJ family response regulator
MCNSRLRPRTVIADDHPIMLSTIARLVGQDCDVVGTAADGDALLREARRLKPDLIILDIFMPVMDGFAAGRQLKVEFPQTRFIYITFDPDPALIAEAVRIGASAVVPKESAGKQLIQAINMTTALATS